ncbi:MAG: hypothetical protein QM778_01535 [Myxococcales bacterium]
MKKGDQEPSDGTPRGESRAGADGRGPDRVVSKGRKVTLTLESVSLHLPGEEPARASTQDSLPSVPAVGVASDDHLDGWNADRIRRSSFPPSASKQTAVAAKPLELVSGHVLEASDEGDALALAGRRSRPTPTLDLVSEMSERFALGDFTGALRAAELVLGQDTAGLPPGDARLSAQDLARHYAQESRQKLEGLYVSRLDAQGRVPKLAVPESEIRWLGLDSRMGFLLSRIDGTSDYETILELSGMPRLEALRSLVELVDAKVVRIV